MLSKIISQEYYIMASWSAPSLLHLHPLSPQYIQVHRWQVVLRCIMCWVTPPPPSNNKHRLVQACSISVGSLVYPHIKKVKAHLFHPVREIRVQYSFFTRELSSLHHQKLIHSLISYSCPVFLCFCFFFFFFWLSTTFELSKGAKIC